MLTVAQTVEYLGVSRTTVWRLTQHGKLASYKIEDRRMYDRAELDRYLDSVAI